MWRHLGNEEIRWSFYCLINYGMSATYYKNGATEFGSVNYVAEDMELVRDFFVSSTNLQ